LQLDTGCLLKPFAKADADFTCQQSYAPQAYSHTIHEYMCARAHIHTLRHTQTHTLAHTYVRTQILTQTHAILKYIQTCRHIRTLTLHLFCTFCHRWAYRVYWPSLNGDSADAVINDPNQFGGCGGNSVQDLHTIEFK